MRRMYSEKQLKDLVNEGIESGEIDAQPIEWEQPLDSSIFEAITGWEINTIFCKLYVQNKKLIGVFLVKYTNKTGSSASPNIYTKPITIPEKYGDKIYDYAGNKVSETALNANISCFPSASTNLAYGGVRNSGTALITRETGKNIVRIFLGGVSTPNDGDLFVEARFWLAL